MRRGNQRTKRPLPRQNRERIASSSRAAYGHTVQRNYPAQAALGRARIALPRQREESPSRWSVREPAQTEQGVAPVAVDRGEDVPLFRSYIDFDSGIADWCAAAGANESLRIEGLAAVCLGDDRADFLLPEIGRAACR